MSVVATLFFHSYKYFSYERVLAIKEVSTLLDGVILEDNKNYIKAAINNEAQLENLTYFESYEIDGKPDCTMQSRIEESCVVSGAKKKQSTRYSAHGLHEYKGRFNPQIVRGILNTLGIKTGGRILDPFCGSGTTLVESTLFDYYACGLDINPLAVKIANAKLKAISTGIKSFKKYFNKVLKAYSNSDQPHYRTHSDHRTKYLQLWFNKEVFSDIERLKYAIDNNSGQYRELFQCIVSDILRDYSLQEPADLRIRKRKSMSTFPKEHLLSAFIKKADLFFENIKSSQRVLGLKPHQSCAYNLDCATSFSAIRHSFGRLKFDGIITSPPYATALPYIDTQRLSLVWLNLVHPKELMRLESNLIGSREMVGWKKSEQRERVHANTDALPGNAYDFVMFLDRSIGEKDGFRRQAMPFLMYRYLHKMRCMFANARKIIKNGAPFALVVGHNRTTLGGKNIDINTPNLLRIVAEDAGWQQLESIPLNTYHRYSLHKENSINEEVLLVLGKK